MSPPPAASGPGALTLVAHELHRSGGMERAFLELAQGALDRGAEVHVVSRVCDLPAQPGLTWRRVRTPSRPFLLAFPLFVLVATVLVGRHRRGIVHTLGAIVFNRADICTVQFCHAGYRAKVGDRRSTRRGPWWSVHERLTGGLSAAMERWSYRAATTGEVVAVSDVLGDEVAEFFPQLAGRISVIPNGVDGRHFRPDPDTRRRTRHDLGLDEGDLVALFVGGDWPRKGLAEAARAVRDVPPWKLVVVGGGDEASVRAALRCTDDRLLFVGRTPDSAPYDAAADVFVLPSAYEGFALVALEAAAAGVPLAVTPATGAGPLVAAGGGWLIGRDSAEIASLLERIRDDPVLRDAAGRAARAAALEFTWASIVGRYFDRYVALDAALGELAGARAA